jgi:hypothetical protein
MAMSKKGFSGSIGGSRGSAGIDSFSIGQSQASGGPVGGYAPKKTYGAQGCPDPENGAGLANTQLSTRMPSK